MYFSRGEQIVIGLCLMGLLMAGGIWLYTAGTRSASFPEEVLLTPPPAPRLEEDAGILVHVCGEVRRPGVYRVQPTNRVLEAIKFAGGVTPQGDLHALNLAAWVKDGERIYVPLRGDLPAVEGAGTRSSPDPAPFGSGGKNSREEAKTPPFPSKPININRASQSQLDLLPGVGPALAQRIIDYRRKNGWFGSPEDLVEVEGIGPKTLQKMRPYVTVNP